MTRSNKLSKAMIVSGLILILSAIGLAAAGAAGPAQQREDPLKLVPASSMFCVRINNLNGALDRVDLFLTGVLPIGVRMPVTAQLGQLLGGPEPVGMDMSGNFVLFGLPSDGNDMKIPSFAMLVPISDYAKFTSGNPNVKPANAQGISKIGAQDQALVSVVQVGGYALASTAGNDQSLLAMKKAMSAATTGVASNLDAAELKRAGSVPVWAYLNVPAVAKKYGPLLKTSMETAKAMVGAMQGAQTSSAASGAQLQTVIDMYTSVLDSLMNQTRFITLSVDPNASCVRAAVVVAALPDTQMADTLKGSPTRLDAKMLGYTKAGAAMNFAVSLDPAKMEKLNTTVLDIMTKSMAKNLSADDVAQIKKLSADSAGAMGGTIVGSMTTDAKSKPPFSLRYVATLKDPAKFNQVLDEAVKMMNSGPLADLYKGMGMKMTADLKRKAATYKGVSIDSMKMFVAMTDANSPANKAVASMYAGGLDIQFAATDGLLVYAVGDPNTAIRETIDQIKAGGPTGLPSEIRTSMQLIPGADKGSFFATFNMLRFMQMGMAIMPMPMPMPQTPTASQSDIALAGTCGDGKATFEVAVPKQHVMEIMAAFLQMQQQQTQPQPAQPPTPPTRGPRGNRPSAS